MEVSVEGVRNVLIFGEVDCWGERETWYRTVCVQWYIRKSWYWRLVRRESTSESMTSAVDYSQMTSFQPQYGARKPPQHQFSLGGGPSEAH